MLEKYRGFIEAGVSDKGVEVVEAGLISSLLFVPLPPPGLVHCLLLSAWVCPVKVYLGLSS